MQQQGTNEKMPTHAHEKRQQRERSMKKRYTHYLKPIGVENWFLRRSFGYNVLDPIGLWARGT